MLLAAPVCPQALTQAFLQQIVAGCRLQLTLMVSNDRGIIGVLGWFCRHRSDVGWEGSRWPVYRRQAVTHVQSKAAAGSPELSFPARTPAASCCCLWDTTSCSDFCWGCCNFLGAGLACRPPLVGLYRLKRGTGGRARLPGAAARAGAGDPAAPRCWPGPSPEVSAAGCASVSRPWASVPATPAAGWAAGAGRGTASAAASALGVEGPEAA